MSIRRNNSGSGNGSEAVSRFLAHLIPEKRNTLRQYLFVLVLMEVAFAIRLLIAPPDGGIQYVTFFPAVAIAAVIGGLWVGLFSALIGVILATYFFWPPYHAFVFTFAKHTVLSNTVFLIDALLVSTAVEAMHRYYGKFVSVEKELRMAASVLQNSSEGVMVTDTQGTIVAVNPAFTIITGYSTEEALGQRPTLLRSNRHDTDFYRDMWGTIQRDGHWEGEIWNRRRDGEAYLEWLRINRIDDDDGNPANYVGIFHDITELRQQDEHIRHLAYHDGLTELPNRMLFHDRLQHAIERAHRDHSRLLVGYIDLDLFKPINDSFGHEVGDRLLQETARRIKGHLRESDTAARVGGDEFVILLESLHSIGNGESLAQALIADISRPMELSGHRIQIGASMGLAFFPDHGTDHEEVLHSADMAMYAAKQAGRNTYLFFEPGMRPVTAGTGHTDTG